MLGKSERATCQRRPLDNGSRRWVWDVTPGGRLARKAAAVQPNRPANRPRSPRTAANEAAMKHPVIKIIVAVTLFLLGLACASLMNEIIHDLWLLTEASRKELLAQAGDFFGQ
jgi:hypothetical protein